MRAHELSWLEDDDSFIEQLIRGRGDECRVAFELFDAGHAIRSQKLMLRDTVDDRVDFVDQCDLLVNERDWVEVKGRELTFTGPDDFPFPTAFVGRCSRWEQRSELPVAVVLLSRVTHAKVVVPVRSTRKHWTREHCWDRVTREWEWSYACPKELLCTWETFLVWLDR